MFGKLIAVNYIVVLLFSGILIQGILHEIKTHWWIQFIFLLNWLLPGIPHAIWISEKFS